MGALRLLVASGNEIARKGLCALAQEQLGWEVAAEARDGRKAVERTKQVKPDVAIIDIDIPSLNGLEATRQITKAALQTKVLLLASHDGVRLLPQALDAGARGYLMTSDTTDVLVSAVEALRHGRSFFTAGVAREFVNRYLEILLRAVQAGNKDAGQLTDRQREVLKLLAEGHTSKQVGFALDISIKTVEAHRANIMQKIDCHSVVELVRYAIRHYIIEA